MKRNMLTEKEFIEMNDVSRSMKAIILRGLPASGKSTWAREYKSFNPNVVIINNDSIRNDIYFEEGHRNWSKEIERKVKLRREEMITTAHFFNEDIIVDNTHMNPWAFQQIQDFCKKLGFTIEIKDFTNVSMEECIKRDALREGFSKVGEDVIRKMAKEHQPIPNVKEPLPNWHENDQPNCIIVDIDGTLAEMFGRSPFDETKVFDDSVREQVLFAVKSIMTCDPNGSCFIFSGRTDSCFKDTTRWLEEKCGFSVVTCFKSPKNKNNEVRLVMRNTGDSRQDAIVKKEMYEKYILNQYNVMAVFDDRATVIRDCWDKLGLFVFRCGQINKDGF